jgi:hypothetical protein
MGVSGSRRLYAAGSCETPHSYFGALSTHAGDKAVLLTSGTNPANCRTAA